jgi:hypothetical protein
MTTRANTASVKMNACVQHESSEQSINTNDSPPPPHLGVRDELGAGVEVPLAPGGDHLDVGLQAVVTQLEAHLVVALAGGADA